MSLLIVLLLAVLPLRGQFPREGSSVPTNFKDLKPIDLTFKVPHIHYMGSSCKGKADTVYAKSGNTYYACVQGKDVCSAEKEAIPTGLIGAFDAAMRVHAARMQEFKVRQAERRAVLGDAFANHRASVSRLDARRQALPAWETAPPAPAAAPEQAPTQVAEDQVRAIAIGASQAEVLRQLGKPYMKITGDSERYTYQLTQGGQAKLDFENGALTQIRVLPAQ